MESLDYCEHRGVLSNGDSLKGLTWTIFKGYLNPSLQQIIEYSVTNNRGYNSHKKENFKSIISPFPYADCQGMSYEESMKVDLENIPENLKKETNNVEHFNLFFYLNSVGIKKVLYVPEKYERIPMFTQYDNVHIAFME